MLDESEFLADHGVRALSKYHKDHPYTFACNSHPLTVNYLPAESDSRMFGGNSNWRGPIWFPINYLLIESLQKFHHYLGEDFQVECPTGSGSRSPVAANLNAYSSASVLESQPRSSAAADRRSHAKTPIAPLQLR